MRVLVVEGNSPEVAARAASVGGQGAAERYAEVLTRRAAERGLDLAARIARPSWPAFHAAEQRLDDVDAVALTGSGVAWSADAPEAAPHRALLERVFAAGLPTIGSCWGLQIAAVVLGGAVRASPNGVELGVARSVALTEAGRAHPGFASKPSVFDSVCIHRDEVAHAPSGAHILASNAHSEIQAMAYEQGGVRFLGFQYHPELGLPQIAGYLAAPGRNALADQAKFEDAETLAQVIADFRAIGEDASAARPLCWRYGVTEQVARADLRERELSNWLMDLPAARRAETPARRQTAGAAPAL